MVSGLILLVLYLLFSVLTSTSYEEVLLTSVTAMLSIMCLCIGLFVFMTGREALSNHILMVCLSLILLVGIYVSGGVPKSPMSYLLVAPPMIAFWLYGFKVGSLASFGFVAIGTLQYLFFPVLGEPLYRMGDMPASYQGHFFSWLLGYFVITSIFGLQRREARLLEGELNTEKQKFSELAFTDGLTNLGNLRCFHEALDKRLANSKGSFYVIYLDLNGFKPVNDCYGHAAGDHVLKMVAIRLTSCVREIDTVARIGGDEFAVLLDNEFTDQSIQNLILRIRSVVSSPIIYEGASLRVTVSIGAVGFPEEAGSKREILKLADERMYMDKTQTDGQSGQNIHLI